MKYKKYPSYKDSGVEWLGEIPSDWNESRLKFIGYTYGGLSGKAGKDFGDEENLKSKRFIPFTNIANNTFIKSDNLGYVIVDEKEEQNRVKANDLFFLMSSENYDDLGKASLLEEDLKDTYLNSFCKGFRLTNKLINPKFLNYLLSGNIYLNGQQQRATLAGEFAKNIFDTATFLKSQGKVDQVKPDYQGNVTTQFLQP